MKRIFTIITVLISLSLIGIILIQLSWLKNMVLLREEQIKHNVQDCTKAVGEELAEHKGNYAAGNNRLGLTPDDFMDRFKPVTVGQRFDAEDIRQKLQKGLFAK